MRTNGRPTRQRGLKGWEQSLLFLLLFPSVLRAEALPPQIYFSTFPALVLSVGIAADNAGNAYVLSLDGGVSLVSPQGVAFKLVAGAPAG